MNATHILYLKWSSPVQCITVENQRDSGANMTLLIPLTLALIPEGYFSNAQQSGIGDSGRLKTIQAYLLLLPRRQLMLMDIPSNMLSMLDVPLLQAGAGHTSGGARWSTG